MDIYKSSHTAEELEVAVLSVFENRPYADGYLDGKLAEYDKFWDTYQDYGRRTSYEVYDGGFGAAWTDELFKPKYPIVPKNANMLFRLTGITDLTKEGVVLDFSNCTNLSYAFAYGALVKLPFIDMSNATAVTATFNQYKGESLHLKFSEKTGSSENMFENTQFLVNLRIEGTIAKSISFPHSEKLTTDAVQSVIDALKDLTGQTSQTFTVHKTVGNNMTAAQKAEITAKNWTLVY